ncbi:CRISPR-associated endoribonuclease Cas6 [Nocardia arizonensis]|uniref:CRISPR-associated endoribonuclease Cas6 n=1 Tax=Nocardia arizonensis TaxID=1141647 RepID=UPI0019504B2A|nr:CRISPR-associated endoribonuclease Cas6 [Nocardia arizonensis]
MLSQSAPGLAKRLHEQGWGRHGMVPFGYSGPVFPQAKKRRGVYSAGGVGYLELGSPVPEVVAAWSVALSGRELIDWGGVALRIRDITLVETAAESETARLRTRTPVVMKGSGRDDSGVRTTRQAWVLPTEPEFHHYFENNLRRKAETLGMAPEVALEQVEWVGPKRSFTTGDGLKPGAPVEVVLRGNPLVLNAVRDWGLGQANAAGFGWIAA